MSGSALLGGNQLEEQRKKLGMEILPSLHRRLKSTAALAGIPSWLALQQAVEEWLSKATGTGESTPTIKLDVELYNKLSESALQAKVSVDEFAIVLLKSHLSTVDTYPVPGGKSRQPTGENEARLHELVALVHAQGSSRAIELFAAIVEHAAEAIQTGKPAAVPPNSDGGRDQADGEHPGQHAPTRRVPRRKTG